MYAIVCSFVQVQAIPIATYTRITFLIWISKCLRQPPHRALKWSVSTCRCDLNVFLCKVFIFFQIITFLESKFEEAGWTANSSNKSSQNLQKTP